MKDEDKKETFREVEERLDAIFRRFSAELIDVMKQLYSSSEIAIAKEEVEGKPETTVPAKKLTKEDIRSVLLSKSKEGWKEKVKAILDKYSKNGTLTGVSEENYEVMLREVKWSCRCEITRDEIASMAESVKAAGNGETLKDIFSHHYATDIDALKPEYYPSFMRDAEVYADA